MNNPVRVSIIVPCFNRLDRTEECWAALVRQTTAALPHEIIFVNNGSTDATSGFLKTLQGRATVLENKTNHGFARACNQGAKIARGGLLLFLNNDTVPLPGWLEPLVALFGREPKAGCAGSRLLYPDGRVQHAGVVIKEIPGSAGIHPEHIFRLNRADSPWVNIEQELQCVTGACLATRRELFQSSGGFDESYVNGCEDIDFCFRIRELGFKVFYCPQSTLIHHESSSEGRFHHDQANFVRLNELWRGRVQVDERLVVERCGRGALLDLKSRIQTLDRQMDALRKAAIPLGAFVPWKAPEPRSRFARWLMRRLRIDKAFTGLQVLSGQIDEQFRRLDMLAKSVEALSEAFGSAEEALKKLLELAETDGCSNDPRVQHSTETRE
jgi:GT2 family glycosyltransferase